VIASPISAGRLDVQAAQSWQTLRFQFRADNSARSVSTTVFSSLTYLDAIIKLAMQRNETGI